MKSHDSLWRLRLCKVILGIYLLFFLSLAEGVDTQPLGTHDDVSTLSLVQLLHTSLSCFISIHLLILFVQPQILWFSVSQGCARGLLGRDPFSISDLSSGTLFLCQACHFTLLFQVKTENLPLLFCLMIYHFLSSVPIKPLTSMLAYLQCACMCVCVCVCVHVCVCVVCVCVCFWNECAYLLF